MKTPRKASTLVSPLAGDMKHLRMMEKRYSMNLSRQCSPARIDYQNLST